jgi:hypothetical protein
MKKSFLCTWFFALFFTCARMAGTNDETSIRTSGAVIFEPDGKTPADSATVKIFNADVVDGHYVSIQTTSLDGRFSLDGLPKGMYTIWAQKDSLVTFQDSVRISSIDTIVRDDTLSCPSTITGIVGVQPQDDPRAVTIQVVGLDKYFNNTDKDGRFTMKNMAKGTYSLLLKSTEQHYTPTAAEISVGACVDTVLVDTIALTYTGIPIVVGISVSYDTVASVVRLVWNSTDYRGFQNYCIFRDFFDSANYSTGPIAAMGDTVFIDSIFDQKLSNGRFSGSDTNDYHFRYRVAIRNNVSAIGPTFKYVDIIAVSPLTVRAAFSFSSRHGAKGYMTNAFYDRLHFGNFAMAGAASVNDSMLVFVRATNATRGLTKLQWRDSAGSVVRTIDLDTTKKAIIDSLPCLWTTLGIHRITCVITDDAGSEWIDTARIAIVADIPKIRLSIKDSAHAKIDTTNWSIKYAYSDTIPLHVFATDSFGSIAGIAWSFGQCSGASLKTMAFDTFAVAPDSAPSRCPIIAKVSDDDGNVVSDTLVVELNLFAPAIDKAAFRSRMYQSGVVFDNRMWLFGGVGIAQETPRITYTSLNDVWVSENGKTWSQITSKAPARSGHTMIVFNNKLWLIGGYASSWGEYENDVWCSPDGVTWTCVTDSAAFAPRIFHSSVVFNNKMWIIGGLTRISKTNDVWSSTNGVSWEKATSAAAFSARSYHVSLVYDDKLWVIGGEDSAYESVNDVWYSSDGATWTVATSGADFSPRQGHCGQVYDDKMWVIGGYGFSSSDMAKDIWNSTDGKAWVQAEDSIGFAPRAFHSSVVFRNRMWVIAGKTGTTTLTNDVWRTGAFAK